MRTIKKGYWGSEVAFLCRELSRNGYAVPCSESFDENVLSAVVDYQRDKGLVADGIVGYNTWERVLFEDCHSNKKALNDDVERLAMLLDCESAALMAVIEVECSGEGGFVAPGKPTILFEGHIFRNELKRRGYNLQEILPGNENILYEKWSRKYYIGGIGEYRRLEQARRIDHNAADASTSWGMFQILGRNYSLCGEKSITDFVAAMHESERKQLILAGRFIKNSGVLHALQKKEWCEFAKRYNGPLYHLNKYDKRLKEAYSMHTKKN